jgi:hemoglobin
MDDIHPMEDATSPSGSPASGVRLRRIDEETIRLLVDAFYTKVRADDQLAPVFEKAIGEDWGPHLEKMYDFWSSVLLTTGRYKGNPMVAHMRIKSIREPMFDRWLSLFAATCAELFEDDTAAIFCGKAVRIAESLKLALFYRPRLNRHSLSSSPLEGEEEKSLG